MDLPAFEVSVNSVLDFMVVGTKTFVCSILSGKSWLNFQIMAFA